MKALELANWAALQCDPGPQVAAELRRLAEVNAELLGALEKLIWAQDHRNLIHDSPYWTMARAAIRKAKEQQ